MSRNRERESGAIILETSIVIPIFLFLILGIYGLFVISAAQSRITHALVQSALSLSQDSYGNSKLDSAVKKDATFYKDLTSMVTDLLRIGNDPYFTSKSDWYTDSYANAQL